MFFSKFIAFPQQQEATQPLPPQQEQTLEPSLKQQFLNQIKPPNTQDRLIIDNFDFSQAFYNLQLKIFDFEEPISLESNVHHVL